MMPSLNRGLNPNGWSVPVWSSPTRKPGRRSYLGITCPALLVTADVDAGAIVTAQIAQEAVGLNPNLQVSHIPGAGHNIHREQFTLFMESVTAFLWVENVAAVAGDTE